MEFDGQGGSYILENGERRRVHGTQDHPDGNRAREAEPEVQQETVQEVDDVSAHA